MLWSGGKLAAQLERIEASRFVIDKFDTKIEIHRIGTYYNRETEMVDIKIYIPETEIIMEIHLSQKKAQEVAKGLINAVKKNANYSIECREGVAKRYCPRCNFETYHYDGQCTFCAGIEYLTKEKKK